MDRLVSEQKFEEAAAAVGKIREAARAAGDETDEAKALVREVQLRTALHGYETSVRFLKDQPWPKGLLPRTTLRLFYAQSLVTYAQAYGWEIGKREKVDSKGAVDLKAWTRDEIQAEAVRAYVDVWKDREALGRVPVNAVAEFVEPNNYPKEIRGTLRDAASYLFAALLADTSGWRPEQSNGVFALDAKILIARRRRRVEAREARRPGRPPAPQARRRPRRPRGVARGARARRRPRSRRASSACAGSTRRSRTRGTAPRSARTSPRSSPAYAGVPWFSMGKAQLADFTRSEDKPGNLVRARALALEADQAYPKSLGADRARSIVGQIEAPDWSMAAMSADGAGRRSIEVTHRNLPALHFRAYAVDLEARIGRAKDYNLLPQGRELDELVAKETPVASFEVALPADAGLQVAPDLRDAAGARPRPARRRRVRGPGFRSRQGAAARRRHDRDGPRPRRAADGVGRRRGAGRLGRDGAPGARDGGLPLAVRLAEGPPPDRRRDGGAGRARDVRAPSADSRSGTFLIARRGDDVALDASYMSLWTRGAPGEISSALVYTDRSIYRPLQKVLWKVVALPRPRATRRSSASRRRRRSPSRSSTRTARPSSRRP